MRSLVSAPRRSRALSLCAAAVVAAIVAACADATSPTDGSSILDNGPNGSSAGSDSAHGPSDPYRYAGLIVWPSTDSLRAWSPVAGTKVDLVRLDAEHGTLTTLASGVTDATGRYVINDPTKSPMGLLAVRAMPDAASPFRPSPLAFALIDVPENARYWYMGLQRKDEPLRPYVPAQAGQVIDAPEWGSNGPGVPGAIIEMQKILVLRYLSPGDEEPYEELSPVIDYGVADDEGRFIMIPSQGTGWYKVRAHAPAGSPYEPAKPAFRTWVPDQTPDRMPGEYPLVIRFRKVGGG